MDQDERGLAFRFVRHRWGSVGISGVNIPLQQHGWYSTDVKIPWIGNNGNVIGQALYDYDLAADYACGCSTWQGSGIAAMYL